MTLFLKLQRRKVLNCFLDQSTTKPKHVIPPEAWGREKNSFSPRLVVLDNISTSAYQLPLYDDCRGRGQKAYWQCILHACGWSVCILMLPLRIGLHTPWWQNVYVPWSTSLIHPDKRCREKPSVKVSECGISRDSGTLNQQGIWKKFYRLSFLFLLLPCLGLYNFPVFIWYGLVCRILRPPRKGTLLGSLFLFYTRVKTAMLLDIRILYQS